MLSFLKLFGWSAVRAPRMPTWTVDRNWNRAEGQRLLKAQAYDKAEYYLRLASAEADLYSFSTAKRVRMRLELAEAQIRQGSFDEAEQTLRMATELAAKSSDHTGYLLCLDALGEVFAGQGRHEAVVSVSQEGIKLESSLAHPDPLRMARRVHRLGIARYNIEASEDAIPALEKGRELYERAYGIAHEETIRVVSELGAIYRAHGRHAEAQRCLERSLRYYQREQGADSAEAIHDLQQLAGSLEESGNVDGAAMEYERLISLRQRDVGRDPDELAELQFSVAGMYMRWGNYARGRELLLDSIGTFKRTAGPRLAVAYETLAQIEELSGRVPDAARELEKAGKVWEKCPGKAAELAANLEYRAELMDQLRKQPEAACLREQAARLSGRAEGA